MQTHQEAELARRLRRKTVILIMVAGALLGMVLVADLRVPDTGLTSWQWWMETAVYAVLFNVMLAAFSDYRFARDVLRKWSEGWVPSQGWRPRG